MKLQLLSAAALAPLAAALPYLASRATPDFSRWYPPQAGDVRSPCPGINTLANHYLLPHDGKNISAAEMTAALKTAYNVGSDFGILVTALATTSKGANPKAGTFDLDNLNEHNYPIEQDASFSRADAYFGDDHSFNQTIFNSVLDLYKGHANTSVAVAAQAHYMRVQDSRARNPQFLYGARQYVAGWIRDASAFAAMGGPNSMSTPVSWYAYWIENEKLPVELGWSPPTEETTLATLTVQGAVLAAAAPQDLAPHAVNITIDTVKDVLELKDPITHILATILSP